MPKSIRDEASTELRLVYTLLKQMQRSERCKALESSLVREDTGRGLLCLGFYQAVDPHWMWQEREATADPDARTCLEEAFDL